MRHQFIPIRMTIIKLTSKQETNAVKIMVTRNSWTPFVEGECKLDRPYGKQ